MCERRGESLYWQSLGHPFEFGSKGKGIKSFDSGSFGGLYDRLARRKVNEILPMFNRFIIAYLDLVACFLMFSADINGD